MKTLASLLITLIVAASIIRPARADDDIDRKQPNAAFGFAGSAAEYSAWERKKGEMHTHYKFALGYGGGLIFEKMFNNTLGIQSGLWVNRIGIDMSLKQGVNPLNVSLASILSSLITIKFNSNIWSIGIPVSLVISVNASIFSFNILPGMKYSQIVESKFKFNRLMRFITLASNVDMMPYISNAQIAFTLGICFKFRVARFVDLFFGLGGELNVNELTKGNDSIALLFNVNANAGLMFRTNIFPIGN